MEITIEIIATFIRDNCEISQLLFEIIVDRKIVTESSFLKQVYIKLAEMNKKEPLGFLVYLSCCQLYTDSAADVLDFILEKDGKYCFNQQMCG